MQRINLTLALLLIAACSDAGTAPPDNPGPPEPPTMPTIVAQVAVVQGADQVDTVAHPLPEPIRVQARDAAKAAVAGQNINFVVTAGGGSVFAGAAITDASGLAQERWTLGTLAGTQELEARAVDPVTGEPIVFASIKATALPARPDTVELAVRDTLLFVGHGFQLEQLGLHAADRYGNPTAASALSVTTTGSLVASPDSIWLAGTGRGELVVAAGARSDTVSVLALVDLTATAWQGEHACFDFGPYVRDNVNVMADSGLIATRSDSVLYGSYVSVPAGDRRPYDAVMVGLYFTATEQRWWADGDVDTLSYDLKVSVRQTPDTLTYQFPRSSSDIYGLLAATSPRTYEGGEWCAYMTVPVGGFQPAVLMER